jgi:glutathione S-transferase
MVPAVLHVYHREGAGRPLRILWTLEEVGVPYEITRMSREEGGSEEHRRRHPLARVPVLESDHGNIFESAAMCMHIGDLHPESGLMPALDTHERGLVYQWAVFAPAEMEPSLFAASKRAAEQDPDRAVAARERFDAAANAVQDALDGRSHLVGDGLTVADVLVATALLFTFRAGFFDELSQPLQAYVGGMRERPAFKRALEKTFG